MSWYHATCASTIQVRGNMKPENIVGQPQESEMAALMEVTANAAPQSWTAIWAET